MTMYIILKCDGGCAGVLEKTVEVPLYVERYTQSLRSAAAKAQWRQRDDKHYCSRCFRFKKGDRVVHLRAPGAGVDGVVTRAAKNGWWVEVKWGKLGIASRLRNRQRASHVTLVEGDKV